MTRLYLQVYATLVAVLLLFFLLASAAWFWLPHDPREERVFEAVGALVGDLLPAPGAPVDELRAALEDLRQRFRADLAVLDADGSRLVSVGAPLPTPDVTRRHPRWFGPGRRGPVIALSLDDGRWLVARFTRRHPPHALGSLVGLALLALAVALGAFPVVRRLTRRLERLQQRVDDLGAGDLRARVEVEGRDEVADLARSFNRAADRIETLVIAQRDALTGASHELRSPLARMRVAIELMEDTRPELRDRISRDIAELDELIDELLLASRLEMQPPVNAEEEVDLLALLAEEAARFGADVSGSPVRIQGDSRMLRRLVRNLLENARRHGSGEDAIDASVEPVGTGGGLVRVCDRGPGVPEAERERIFEPFYRPTGSREGPDGGVGLGLSLVRRIAQLHRGDAKCRSRDGGGSCFEVTLFGV